jgi:DNA-binding LacI/PurR family transcriptional regulator
MAASIKDVAKRSGVSYKTVSRVINGEAYVSEGTRQRVLDAIAALGYQPHHGARSLRWGRHYTLRLLMHSRTERFLLNPFQDEVIAGVVDTAARRGYAVMIEPVGRPDIPQPMGLVERRVDGTVLLDSRVPCVLAAELLATKVPAVVVANRDVGGLGWVDADFRGGAWQMVEYLLGLGHRQFAHISDDPALHSTQARLEGYCDALQAAGVDPDPALIVRAGQLRHEGYRAAEELLSSGKGFTAIVCVNDLTAFGAIECLQRHGIRVPEDISVSGYDDIYPARHAAPPLTTVRLPWYDMGATATEQVIGVVEGNGKYPEGVVLPTELALRSTTAPVALATPQGRVGVSDRSHRS